MSISTKLYVPEKLKVGFNKRKDTYTEKLGYVIYYDHKGVLRKEKSCQSWRDKSIPMVDIDNEPTEGFVLNKKTGDYTGSRWENGRQAHIRVYDPRGFEFEISVNNLLYILENCDCFKGKGIEGKMVYAWDGTELVLVPCSSGDYKSITEHSDLQKHKFSFRSLVFGARYKLKDGRDVVYIGLNDHYEKTYVDQLYGQFRYKRVKKRRHIFRSGNQNLVINNSNQIAYRIGEDISPEAYTYLSDYNASFESSVIVELFIGEYKDESFMKRFEDGRQQNVLVEETESNGKKRIFCYRNDYEYCYKKEGCTKVFAGTQYLLREYVLFDNCVNTVVSCDRYPGTWSNSYNRLLRDQDMTLYSICPGFSNKLVCDRDRFYKDQRKTEWKMLSQKPFIEDNGMILYMRMENGSVFPYTDYY